MKHIYDINKEELDNYFASLLPIKKEEKDKYGEVFTNPLLIEKQLDLLPKKVWTNHTNKWLDPCAGAGFYMICVYFRLMKGLEKWEPNRKKRSNHIIHNMLYMVELNKANYKLCKNIFMQSSDAKTNTIICADFLDESIFPDTTFQIIVGNPPFQDDYGKNKKGKRITGGSNRLYERIFLKAFELLSDEGYITFIVPDNIFSGNKSESYSLFLNNYVPFVSFNPSNQLYFKGIQQTICYFLLEKIAMITNKNIKEKRKTMIETNDDTKFELVLQNRPVNPIRNWNRETEKLITTYVSNVKNNVIYNRGKKITAYTVTKKSKKKYDIVYTPSKHLQTNKEDLVVGSGIKKAIIFTISPKLEFVMDYDGTKGIGPNTCYIPFQTNKEGKYLETFLNSNNYKKMMYASMTTRQFIRTDLLQHLILTKIYKRSNNKTRKISK